eukprot:1344985-Pleurochrysis_carterae.AAC.1
MPLCCRFGLRSRVRRAAPPRLHGGVRRLGRHGASHLQMRVRAQRCFQRAARRCAAACIRSLRSGLRLARIQVAHLCRSVHAEPRLSRPYCACDAICKAACLQVVRVVRKSGAGLEGERRLLINLLGARFRPGGRAHSTTKGSASQRGTSPSTMAQLAKE